MEDQFIRIKSVGPLKTTFRSVHNENLVLRHQPTKDTCWSTCIEILTGLPEGTVTTPELSGKEWTEVSEAVLNRLGLQFERIIGELPNPIKVPHLLTGRTISDTWHTVLYFGNMRIWDPYEGGLELKFVAEAIAFRTGEHVADYPFKNPQTMKTK